MSSLHTPTPADNGNLRYSLTASRCPCGKVECSGCDYCTRCDLARPCECDAPRELTVVPLEDETESPWPPELLRRRAAEARAEADAWEREADRLERRDRVGPARVRTRIQVASALGRIARIDPQQLAEDTFGRRIEYLTSDEWAELQGRLRERR